MFTTETKNAKLTLALKNILYGFGSKFIILVLGVIIPRIVIVSYGSELNGFLSTISQIFTYFTLLEAGIGNSAINAFFSPLEKQDYAQANRVAGQARRYYRKATTLYVVCVLLFAFVYPFLMPSTLDKALMIKVILLQGAPSVIGYYFRAVYDQLLTADGKYYVSENVQLVLHIFMSAAKIALILCGFDIVAVQLAYCVIWLLRSPITILYCKRKYPWLAFAKADGENLLQERSAFIVHEVASAIFFNTDVFIVSVFCGFEAASIYTVYNMIFSSLNSLLNTANGGLGFVLGRNLDKPIEKLRQIFDVYSTLYTFATFVVMTTATVLSIPFVTLYTQGVDDVNYIVKWVPALFGLINVMSGARAIPQRLISVSGHAKSTQNRSLIEMILNIVFSVVLVYFLDIYGVLLGTVIALLYRMNDIILYANRHILHRSSKKSYACLLSYLLLFAAAVYVASNVTWHIHSYLTFAVYGVLCVVVLFAVFLIPTLLIEKEGLRFAYRYVRRKRTASPV